MAEKGDIRCFTCGLPTGGTSPRFNTLESGELCPSCRDRVLEAVGPALPEGSEPEVEEEPRQGTLFGAQLRVVRDDEDELEEHSDEDEGYDRPWGA